MLAPTMSALPFHAARLMRSGSPVSWSSFHTPARVSWLGRSFIWRWMAITAAGFQAVAPATTVVSTSQ